MPFFQKTTRLNGLHTTIQWEGNAKTVDKTIAQGGELLVPMDQWGELSGIQGNDLTVIGNPMVEQAFQTMLGLHKPHHDTVMFSLCTATRPYTNSRKWKELERLFANVADLCVVSTCGVIPLQFEGQYPYLNYNDAHDESKFFDEYSASLAPRMKQFLQAHPYKHILFHHRHNMRNLRIAQVVGPWAVEQGLCQDYAILPTKEHYLQAQAQGFAEQGYKLYPELFPTMLNPVIEQVYNWAGCDPAPMITKIDKPTELTDLFE